MTASTGKRTSVCETRSRENQKKDLRRGSGRRISDLRTPRQDSGQEESVRCVNGSPRVLTVRSGDVVPLPKREVLDMIRRTRGLVLLVYG